MNKVTKNKLIYLYHKCQVCENHYGFVLGTLNYILFDNSRLHNTYEVVCCSNCGFVFCNTSSIQKDYNDFYEESFYSNDYLDKKIEINELDYIRRLIERIKPHFDKSSKIFDIGCGNGLLLREMQNLRYENLYGVDISLSCVNMLINKGFNVKRGSVFDIPFNEKADVIILSHVLEHIIDLNKALDSIKNKLSDNGIVYVEVPNLNRYDKIRNHLPLRYFYFQHLVHFDEFHLCKLFENNGFLKIRSGFSGRTEGNLTMPCIWAIFYNNNNYEPAERVKTWFDNINLDINNILKNLEKSKKDVYIWGIGTHMNLMLSMSPLKNCNIKYYVDNDKRNQEKTINGNKIYPISKLSDATENDVIVIGAPTHAKEMYDYLTNELKFKGKIIVCDFGNVYETIKN